MQAVPFSPPGPLDAPEPGVAPPPALAALPAMGFDRASGRPTDHRGVPFREDPGVVDARELEQLQRSGLVRFALLDMTLQPHQELYCRIRQLIVDKKALLLRPILTQTTPGGWLFAVEWLELYVELPRQRQRRLFRPPPLRRF